MDKTFKDTWWYSWFFFYISLLFEKIDLELGTFPVLVSTPIHVFVIFWVSGMFRCRYLAERVSKVVVFVWNCCYHIQYSKMIKVIHSFLHFKWTTATTRRTISVPKNFMSLHLWSWILKDTLREKVPSNKSPAPRKNMNMGVWAVGTLNQLFIRGS